MILSFILVNSSSLFVASKGVNSKLSFLVSPTKESSDIALPIVAKAFTSIGFVAILASCKESNNS